MRKTASGEANGGNHKDMSLNSIRMRLSLDQGLKQSKHLSTPDITNTHCGYATAKGTSRRRKMTRNGHKQIRTTYTTEIGDAPLKDVNAASKAMTSRTFRIHRTRHTQITLTILQFIGHSVTMTRATFIKAEKMDLAMHHDSAKN